MVCIYASYDCHAPTPFGFVNALPMSNSLKVLLIPYTCI